MFISCPNKSLFHFVDKMSRLAALPYAPPFFPSLDVPPQVSRVKPLLLFRLREPVMNS